MIKLSSWEDVRQIDNSELTGHELEVPDNGYTMCILWAAPRDHVCRVPFDIEAQLIAVRSSRQGGEVEQVKTRTRTAEEIELIREMTNSYLADAGIPPRPDGFRWYLAGPRKEAIQGYRKFDEVISAVSMHHGSDESAVSVVTAARKVLGKTSDVE